MALILKVGPRSGQRVPDWSPSAVLAFGVEEGVVKAVGDVEVVGEGERAAARRGRRWG